MDSTESNFSNATTTGPRFNTHSVMTQDEVDKLLERERAASPHDTVQVATPAEYVEMAGFPAVTVDAMSYLERPVDERVMEWARAFHGVKSPWLWLMGPTGRGKTVSAACAVAEVARRMDAGEVPRCDVAFVRADHLTGEYSSVGFYGADSKYRFVQRVSSVGLLVLDDLGSEARGAVPFEAVGGVLGQRLDDMTPTIVTTQYGASEFMERMVGRGADRRDTESTLGRVCDALAGWPHGLTNEQRYAAMKRNVIELDGECLRTSEGKG